MSGGARRSPALTVLQPLEDLRGARQNRNLVIGELAQAARQVDVLAGSKLPHQGPTPRGSADDERPPVGRVRGAFYQALPFEAGHDPRCGWPLDALKDCQLAWGEWALTIDRRQGSR